MHVPLAHLVDIRNIIGAAVNFRELPELWVLETLITMPAWIRTCQGDSGKKRGRQIQAAPPII
jgi:hypothetical protein